MAFFSVVIPVYNKVATLSDSLDCLYRQTFRDFEVIAVDHGSTDGSLKVLREHEKAGLLKLYQRSPPGLGGYAARNFGAEKASADWLVFFDGDGILLFDHLSCFAVAIAHYPDIALFINAYQKMKSQQRLPCIQRFSAGRMKRLEALTAFACCDFIHMNGACMRREWFLSLGGFPAGRYSCAGDAYFWLKALCELDEIHYNDTTTNLWLLEHSDNTQDKRHLINLHLGLDLLHDYASRLGSDERRQLRLAINRKVLSWAVEKSSSANQ
ncbi:glycosyltransferase family A protein [Halomonas vilamensis]|uniref:Glycosyltransferase family A protein n=1 Tax=Vreelandella vilamensis TaxID=531309 RepID=A0ABU1H5G8_9GAMM|nr:glycosyltransferase family A protein [Halomonas vilamensis]MDR5899549.1 glycosyltransferase family A protein [Halomonas vilamensis]